MASRRNERSRACQQLPVLSGERRCRRSRYVFTAGGPAPGDRSSPEDVQLLVVVNHLHGAGNRGRNFPGQRPRARPSAGAVAEQPVVALAVVDRVDVALVNAAAPVVLDADEVAVNHVGDASRQFPLGRQSVVFEHGAAGIGRAHIRIGPEIVRPVIRQHFIRAQLAGYAIKGPGGLDVIATEKQPQVLILLVDAQPVGGENRGGAENRRQVILVIRRIHMQPQPNLMQVAQATDPLRLYFRPGQRRQQQRR